MELDIFEPNMAIRNEVGMREGGEKFDFDKHLFQPGVIVSDRNSLTGEVTQRTTIYLMTNQQNNALAAAAELSLLDKEPREVVGTKSISSDACTFLGRRRTRDEFGIVYGLRYHLATGATGQGRLGQTTHMVGRGLTGARVTLLIMAIPQHAKVLGVNPGLMMIWGGIEVTLGRRRAQRPLACRTFGDRSTSDLEALRGVITNDEGIAVATNTRRRRSVSYSIIRCHRHNTIVPGERRVDENDNGNG